MTPSFALSVKLSRLLKYVETYRHENHTHSANMKVLESSETYFQVSQKKKEKKVQHGLLFANTNLLAGNFSKILSFDQHSGLLMIGIDLF